MAPVIEPGQHVAILGITGCGKSTLTRALVLPEARVLVIDRMHEWGPDDPELSDFRFAYSYEEFLKIYEEDFEHVRLVVRVPIGMSSEELAGYLDRILYVVYRAESQRQLELFVVLEEVQFYAPNNGMVVPMLVEIYLTARKYKISVIANSQKPALVARVVTGQSRHVFIGQFHDPRDAAFFKEFGVEQSPAQFDWYHFQAGQGLRLIKS